MTKILKKLFTLKYPEHILIFFLRNFHEIWLFKKIRPQCDYYAKGSIRECVRDDIAYILDVSDYMEWSLYFYSTADSSLGVTQCLSTGHVVLDIGGNIGQTAMNMALKVGDNGKVYSFEPFPSTFEKFVRNLSLNQNIRNITPVNSAIGAEICELQMIIPSSLNSGENKLIRSRQPLEEGVVSVPVLTVDHFVKSTSIQRVDFIKIDVEGFEMDVIKGAHQTIIEHKPALYIEMDDRLLQEQGSSAAELCRYLTDIGYDICEYGSTNPIAEVDFTRHIDIYCITAVR